MQFLKLPYELITDTNISSNEFRIYAYLLSRYNETKQSAYPSIEVISKQINISIRTVKTSIKKLVELGYMIISKKKGLHGNYNEYREFKFLILRTKKNIEPTKRKPFIASYFKEGGIQMEIDGISPYTIEHQQKISLILKQGIKLTEKQEFLIGDMDIEVLRKSIYRFKKKQGKYFSLLLNLYIDQAEQDEIYISRNIERFLKGNYIRVTDEERETQKALRELELYGVPCGD